MSYANMLRNATRPLTPASGDTDGLRAELADAHARISELERLADTDPLTELPNRRPFVRATERVIRQYQRHGTSAAVMFVDVDGLKAVNDAFGHAAGDEALRHLARLLQGELRGSDLVARIGGDEFGLVLDHVSELAARAKAVALAAAVQSEPLIHGDAAINLRLSIGVAAVRQHDSTETILGRADDEMYRRKRAQSSAR